MQELLTNENFDKVRTIAIYGGQGSGKTALAYKIMDIVSQNGKKIYFLRHPKPDMIAKLGWNNLDSLEDVEVLEDCVLYIDEPQLHISIYDKKSNAIIAKICSLARQKNILLIISSSDTRVFTKHNEAYFDLWMVKDLDYDMVKQGSKIKKMLSKYCLFDPVGFRLNKNQFLSECRALSGLNGLHEFEIVDYFTEEHSKPYRRNYAATYLPMSLQVNSEKNQNSEPK